MDYEKKQFPFICPGCGAIEVDGYLSHMHDCPVRPVEPKSPSRRQLAFAAVAERADDLYQDVRWQLQQVRWVEVWAVLAAIVIVCAFIWLCLEAMEGRIH